MNEREFKEITQAIGNTHFEITITDNSTFLKRMPTTTHEKLALRLALKSRFPHIFNDSMLDKLEKEYLTLKTKLDKEKALKERKAREEWLKQQKEPLNWFTRILRNNWHITNPEELDLWLSETTTEEKQKVYTEFKKLAKSRGLGMRKETIEFALAFLQSALSLNPNQNQQGEKKTWRKLKLPKLLKKA